MAKQLLVNNGLPEGITLASLVVGDILLVMYEQVEPRHVILLPSDDMLRQRTYKGPVVLNVLDYRSAMAFASSKVTGDRIIRRVSLPRLAVKAVANAMELIEQYDSLITDAERAIRYVPPTK